MKKTYLKKIGKRGKINLSANKKLKEIYAEKGINRCEIRLDGNCVGNWTLGFAHKHRRIWYYDHEGLDSYSETIMACSYCHNRIDTDKDLLEATFNRLRGNVSK
jgi:hypothetical protein